MDTNQILKKLKKHSPTILGSGDFSTYAVLLPLIEKDNETHILFEIRSHKLRRQPGEICFPGGRMDKQDKTDQDTAVRETTEELGISENQITDIFPLDYLVSPFGMIVYPHVGVINDPETIIPNPSEVEDVFTVPLSFFKKTPPKIHYVDINMKPKEDFPFDLIVGGENYNWRTGKIDEYFYIYDDKVIWGLTAKILAHFIDVIK
ncbi:NUDIX hydrolase [Virgibacillus byunsanensis]|uniref:NUDIX hydrolase n=1 Tax=Virgibacillus byunsanensis TaxID=570945 RepID=A0ABW3LMB0_9BACI